MKQVLCTLENASNHISGVNFFKHEKGMISEPLEDDEAGRKFANIEGYHFIDIPPTAKFRPPEQQTGEVIVVKTESVVKGIAPIAEEIAPAVEATLAEEIAPAEEAVTAAETTPIAEEITPVVATLAEETPAKKSKTAK